MTVMRHVRGYCKQEDGAATTSTAGTQTQPADRPSRPATAKHSKHVTGKGSRPATAKSTRTSSAKHKNGTQKSSSKSSKEVKIN